MPDNSIIGQLLAYLPPDRAAVLLGGGVLPETDTGAVLFSDISGFTPLTEAIIARYGPRQGGEQFTDRLNAVYDALIAEVERFGGSIVGFAGDAMTVWFGGDDGRLAVTAGVHMQRAMAQFASVALSDGATVSLAMKVAVATGKVRRFAVGDPTIQFMDVIAGDVMERVSACEGVAKRGEITVDARTARHLGALLAVLEWRSFDPARPGEDAAVIGGLAQEAPARPRAPLALPPDSVERLRGWLLPEVSRRIISGQDVFLTELRPSTALFAHFKGIDFEHDADAPRKLDAYVRWLQRIIARLEGIFVQLTIGEKGNYFYAAWGAPIAHDDDTMRACTAALEIARPPPELSYIRGTQIGITCGTMRTGAYGNRQRRVYGILGDDTNLAARLMAKAGPDEILVSSHAARRQFGTFELLALPGVTVKGKREPVPIFRLVGRRQTGILGWKDAAPMVGRRRERARAAAKLRLAAGGRGQVISLSAEAGMGKSRLLRELLREAESLGFTAFAGDCPALGREASYSVWIPIWRAFFQVPDAAAAPEVLARLEADLAAVDPDLSARAPLLGPLLNFVFPDNDLTRTLDAKVRRSSLEGLVIECLRFRARSGPILFVLEECHWIDEASRNLLGAVIQASARFAVALMLAHRPVKPGELFGPNDTALDYFTAIELGDLPPDEARELAERNLAGAFGGAVPPKSLVDAISARAGGNPFFIEEVINLLKARGADLAAPRVLEAAELPESMHSLMLGRIDQLSEDAQTTLKVASVIGRLFRSAVLFGVHPLERIRPTIPAQLAEMQRRDIVLPEPAGADAAYLFKHIVIQEVAYESLPFGFRAQIHETIGRYLEEIAGENLRPWIDLLAFHYGRSDRADKQRVYLVAAADAARAAYALQSAILHYERALKVLDGPERSEVLAKLGEVLELAGRWNDAFARFREARDEAERTGQPVRRAAMAGAIGDLHRKRGEFTDAEKWIAVAREENATQGNEAGVALMLHLEGTLCAQTGNFARATELLERAFALREKLGDEAGMAKTLNNLGIVARSQGAIELALGCYERSLAIRRHLNDRREIANSLNNLGFTRRFRKEFALARALLEESVQMNRSVGDRWSTANALTSLAELAIDTDDADLAHRCLKESITINRELGDRRALAFLLEGFGRLGRMKRQPAAALLFFSAAKTLRENIGAPLEPADAESLARVMAQAESDAGPLAAQSSAAEGRSLSLGEVLDRATVVFG